MSSAGRPRVVGAIAAAAFVFGASLPAAELFGSGDDTEREAGTHAAR